LITNKNIVRVLDHSYHNGPQGFSINASLDFQVTLTKVLCYIKIKLPENDYDEHFQKEILRTVIDFSKIMKATQSNFITAKIVDGFLGSASRELRFPFEKVGIQLLG
jgi:hypothetical protein